MHPRLGALDVLPFVPLRDLTMDDAVAVARRVGASVASAYGLPVYLYGVAASRPERRLAREIRRGEYEGLAARLAIRPGSPTRAPPPSSRASAPSWSARARCSSPTTSGSTHRTSTRPGPSARAVRESRAACPPCRLSACRSPVAASSRSRLNLVDYRRTGIARAYDAVAADARWRGIGITRGELVGLTPRAALEGRTPESVGLAGLSDSKLPRDLPVSYGPVSHGTISLDHRIPPAHRAIETDKEAKVMTALITMSLLSLLFLALSSGVCGGTVSSPAPSTPGGDPGRDQCEPGRRVHDRGPRQRGLSRAIGHGGAFRAAGWEDMLDPVLARGAAPDAGRYTLVFRPNRAPRAAPSPRGAPPELVMPPAMAHLIVAIAGILLILAIVWDAFEALVLPRTATRTLARRGSSIRPRGRVGRPWRALSPAGVGARASRHLRPLVHPDPDGLLATRSSLLRHDPVGLGSRFNAPHRQLGFWTDLYLSGTTLFTLASAMSPHRALARTLTVIEAGGGLRLPRPRHGLFPRALPGLLAPRGQHLAPRRRARLAAQRGRAPAPPRPRHAGARTLLRDWERWSAELMESHLSYPVLMFFRSQHEHQSWLGALTPCSTPARWSWWAWRGAPGRQASSRSRWRVTRGGSGHGDGRAAVRARPGSARPGDFYSLRASLAQDGSY